MEELKAIVKSILRSHPSGRATVKEIDKQFENQEGVSLQNIAVNKLGFTSIYSLLESWQDEFMVSGHEVQVKQLDHISEMNRHTKWV